MLYWTCITWLVPLKPLSWIEYQWSHLCTFHPWRELSLGQLQFFVHSIRVVGTSFLHTCNTYIKYCIYNVSRPDFHHDEHHLPPGKQDPIDWSRTQRSQSLISCQVSMRVSVCMWEWVWLCGSVWVWCVGVIAWVKVGVWVWQPWLIVSGGDTSG